MSTETKIWRMNFRWSLPASAEAKAAPGTPKSGSFDTDDFFEEALKRSYGDK